jgi:hypothetical protein
MSFLDLNELAGENERLTSGTTGNFLDNFVRLPEGAGHVNLRLLPPAGKGMFGRAKNPFYKMTRTHRVNDKSLHCRKEFVNGKWVGDCKICNYLRWLWEESEKKSPDEAARLQTQYRNMKALERYYYNAIVRQQYNNKSGEMEKNVGPKILAVGKTLHKMIIRSIVGDPETDEKPLGDVTDVNKGRDFKLIKTLRQSGASSFPNYDSSKFLDQSPLGSPEEVEKWLASLHDLESLRIVKSNEELDRELKIHLGVIVDVDEGMIDPSEYAPNSGTAISSVSSPTVVATKEQEKPKPSYDDMGSMPLIEDEFMNDLRNL